MLYKVHHYYLNCIIHYFIVIKLGQSYLQGSWSFAQVLRIPEAGSTYGDTPPYLGMSSSTHLIIIIVI